MDDDIQGEEEEKEEATTHFGFGFCSFWKLRNRASSWHARWNFQEKQQKNTQLWRTVPRSGSLLATDPDRLQRLLESVMGLEGEGRVHVFWLNEWLTLLTWHQCCDETISCIPIQYNLWIKAGSWQRSEYLLWLLIQYPSIIYVLDCTASLFSVTK